MHHHHTSDPLVGCLMKKKNFISKQDQMFYKLEREKIWIEQNRKCFYCNKTISRAELTADHIIPICKTKYHSSKNIVVACQDCNEKKDCKTVEEFIQELVKPQELPDYMLAAINRIEMRTRLAEFRLDFDTKGSFNKWCKYHEKRKRWPPIGVG